MRPFTDRSPRTVAVEQPQKVQEQIVPLSNKYVWRHDYGKTDQCSIVVNITTRSAAFPCVVRQKVIEVRFSRIRYGIIVHR